MSTRFSMYRLRELLRSELITRARSLLTITATLAALMLVSDVLTGRSDGGRLYQVWFLGILMIWGTLAAGGAFRELHDSARSAAFLLLPASALEKTLAQLLRVSVGLPLYLLVLMVLVAVVGQGTTLLVFGERRGMFDPFAATVWNAIPQVIVLQALYFAGAAWFRRAPVIKTTLAITLLGMGLVAVAVLTLRIGFGHGFFAFNDIGYQGRQLYLSSRGVFDALGVGLHALYFVALPVVCWVIAWLRVTEKQVRDGV